MKAFKIVGIALAGLILTGLVFYGWALFTASRNCPAPTQSTLCIFPSLFLCKGRNQD
ncbi:MAG TPA: hypothetical protein VHH32_04280 [Gemmatimonadales bacterium]|nr:hypothetical protein [Gemmatimonadales bacterium]